MWAKLLPLQRQKSAEVGQIICVRGGARDPEPKPPPPPEVVAVRIRPLSVQHEEEPVQTAPPYHQSSCRSQQQGGIAIVILAHGGGGVDVGKEVGVSRRPLSFSVVLTWRLTFAPLSRRTCTLTWHPRTSARWRAVLP